MPFDLTVRLWTGREYNWFDLPDTDLPGVQKLVTQFNAGDYHPSRTLTIEGTKTVFEKTYREIRSMEIGR